MKQLEYRIEDQRCYLSGELSFDSVAQSAGVLDALVSMAKNLTVSFAGIEHADSAATAFMVELYRRIRVNGGDVSFVDIPPHIVSVLAMTRLDTLLPIAK